VTERTTKPQEIAAVLRLAGPERFRHFVGRVADEERAWGLWSDGWALMSDAQGTAVFPVWPAAEYADLHRTGEWSAYEAREIPVRELLDALIPRLEQDDVPIGVFPTPTGQGVIVPPEQLADALREELEKYE
jgi:hypothetical protein